MKNPKWARDELILALDLYFRRPPLKASKNDPEVIALSEFLNSLPIHPQRNDLEKFRNPNGVYMKLCNYLRFDPNYEGEGLKAGGKLEEVIWNEYAEDRVRLKEVCEAIKSAAAFVPRPVKIEEDDEEFSEGRVLTRLHQIRERSPCAWRIAIQAAIGS